MGYYVKIFLCFFLYTINVTAQSYEEQALEMYHKGYKYFYSNQDSVYYYFDKIYELSIQEKDFYTALEFTNLTCISAAFHYNLDKIKSSLAVLDSLIPIKQSILDTLPGDKGQYIKDYFLINKGNYYYSLGDFDNSRNYFKQLVEDANSLPDSVITDNTINSLSSSYNFIAKTYSLENKFELANQFYEKSIRLYKKYKPEDIDGLNKIYNLYAQVFDQQGKYKEANKYWLRTFDYYVNNYNPKNRNSIVTTAISISGAYKNLDQIDSANHYLKSTKKFLLKDEPFLSKIHIAKAEILQHQKKYGKALVELNKALEFARENEDPVVHNKIGSLYFESKNIKKSLLHYQEALKTVSDNFSSDNLNHNPSINNVNQKILFLQLLKNKAIALNQLNKQESYEMALKTIEAAVSALDTLKPDFVNELDKILLIENAYPIFETGLSSLFNLYSLTQEEKYLEKIFRFMEKSKSTVLLEAILGMKATSFANIPTHLTDKEKELKSNINYFNKSLESSPENSQLKEDLFNNIQERAELIKHIESTYPQYYNLKYNSEVIELDEAQKLCKEEKAVISYFFGENTIYAVILDSSYKECIRIPVTDSLIKNMNNLKTFLANPGSDLKDISALSHNIYTKILEPLIGNKKYKKLTIIPDGPLNYIPFEALNTNYENPSYLMENIAVSYTNSLTLLSQLKENLKYNSDVLAFAPTFNNESTLSQLPNNIKETSGIFTHFMGKEFINEEATLDNFKLENNKFGIIHLATHAILNDKNPELSYLAFTENKTNNYLLYTSDLYNLNLNASLITLSACETDLGDLNKGEGLISLSRGFFYAGAKSILSTKWKINDASTSHIMDRFYYYLSKGENKDRALQQAKLDFVKTNKQNPLSHPYYWSAFVLSGNADAVTSSTTWFWFIPALVLLLLLVVFIFLKRKRLV